MAPSQPNSIDLRFLEHPTMGIVALKADMGCEDVEAFINWIRQVLTLIAEQNAWQNLPSTLTSATPLSAALLETCSSRKRHLDDGGSGGYNDSGSYGGYGSGGYQRSKRPNTGSMKCYLCGAPGHRSAQCPQNAGSGYGRENASGSYESYGYGTGARNSVGTENDRNYGSTYGSASYAATGANSSPICQDRGSTVNSMTRGEGNQAVSASAPLPKSPSRASTTNVDPATPQNPQPNDAPAASAGRLQIENDDWVPRVEAIKNENIVYDVFSSGED